MLRVLLLVDTFKLLDAVSNALDFEDVVPEGVGNLDVVLDGSRVSELRFLGYTYELLDVVPLAFEKGCVVRYGVIRVVWRGDPGHNRELLDLLGMCMEVGEWRLGVEEFDALYILWADGVAPVGIEDVRDYAGFVGGRKADVACLLADDAHNAAGILIEDDDADTKAEVLEILTDAEEVACEVVVQGEVADL